MPKNPQARTSGTRTPTQPPALGGLADLLAEEPALRAVVGREPVVAVPDTARALFVAALAGVTTRRPDPRGGPDRTRGRAARARPRPVPPGLAGRAVPRLGDAAVRAGVAVARDDGPAPAGHVAAPSGRRGRSPPSSSRPSGRSCSGSGRTSKMSSRSSCGPASRSTATCCSSGSSRWVTGASTRSRRAARSRCADRSSTCTRRPTTTRCASTSGATRSTGSRRSRSADQRSTHDVDELVIFPARELLPTPEVREPRRGARAEQPWGAEQWERLAEGQTFDGMESWLPWLCDGEHLLPDLLPADALGPAVRAAADARPRAGAARRGGGARARRSRPRGARARPPSCPASRCRSSGCSRTRPRARPTCSPRPRPRHAVARRDRVRPRGRRRRRPGRAAAGAARRGFRVVLAAEGTGSADRLGEVLADEGIDARARDCRSAPGSGRHRRRAARAGRGPAAARSSRSSPRPTSPGGAACTGDRAGAAPHRLLRGPRAGRLRRAPPPRRRALRGHGQPCDRRRRARLPAARVQGRRQALRADRPGRHGPQVHRRRHADAQPHGRRRLREAEGARPLRDAGDRAGAGGAVPPAARHARPRVPARHAVAARGRGGVPVRGDARPAGGDRRREGRHGAGHADGPARLRRRRVRQDRGRGARRVQGGAGRQAGRGPRADHAAREPARPDLPRALRELPGAGRGAVALPHGQGAERGRRGRRERRRRRRDRHAPAALRGHRSSRTSACS